MRRYHCGAEDCPGHIISTATCRLPRNSGDPARLSRLQEYHCGASGCPGHFSESEKCTEQFRAVLKPRIETAPIKLRSFWCEAPLCPGHLSESERCPEKLILRERLDVKRSPIEFIPNQYNCGASNCPGHSTKAGRCIEKFSAFEPTAAETVRMPIIPIIKCGAPNCPGHQDSNEICESRLSLRAQDGLFIKDSGFIARDIQQVTPKVQVGNIGSSKADAPAGSLNCVGGVIFFIIAFLLFITYEFLYAVQTFGAESMLVAAEGFFIFAGWTGLRAARLFGKADSRGMEVFGNIMAICFGVFCGTLAAYLLLTTPEGQAITQFVTANTARMVGSLLMSVLGSGFLEIITRALFK